MKKYMAMYMAPMATMQEMMKAKPEESKAGMDAWMKWADKNKKMIVDLGMPLGKTKRVAKMGMSDTSNEIGGYSIVQGDSFEAVAKIFADHPHLGMKGATVDLLEMMPMPGM